MDFQEDLIRLDLDCAPSSFEPVPSRNSLHSHVGLPRDALVYFRQEPGRKKKFLVGFPTLYTLGNDNLLWLNL